MTELLIICKEGQNFFSGTLLQNGKQSFSNIRSNLHSANSQRSSRTKSLRTICLGNPVISAVNDCGPHKPLIALPVHYRTQITARGRRHAPCTRLFRLQSLLKCGRSCRCSRWKTKIVWKITVSSSIIKDTVQYYWLKLVLNFQDAYILSLHSLVLISQLMLCRIWHLVDRASWYVLIIKPTRCTNFSNWFLE